MTSEVVPYTQENLVAGANATGLTLKRLRQFRQWVTVIATEEEAGAVYHNIHDLTTWMKIRGTADELRIQAMQIEAAALRKLGRSVDVMGDLGLKKSERYLARWLANLSAERFKELMDDIVKPEALTTWRSAIAYQEKQRTKSTYPRQTSFSPDRPKPERTKDDRIVFQVVLPKDCVRLDVTFLDNGETVRVHTHREANGSDKPIKHHYAVRRLYGYKYVDVNTD